MQTSAADSSGLSSSSNTKEFVRIDAAQWPWGCTALVRDASTPDNKRKLVQEARERHATVYSCTTSADGTVTVILYLRGPEPMPVFSD